MAVKKHGVTIETPGPSILLLLVVSVSVAAVAMAIVWFVFFRT
jgi:hypothetical protein